MSFSSNLNHISAELNKHKGKNRTEILQEHIQKRLNESLSQYYKELGNSLSYLSSNDRDKINVVKKMNKEV